MTNTFIPKALKPLFRAARRSGWKVTGGGGRHFKLVKPGERPIIVSGSGSDHREMENVKSLMRQRGVRL